MARCKLTQWERFAAKFFQRFKSASKCGDKVFGFHDLTVAQILARIGRVQTLFDSAQGFERARETRSAAARPRAAQYCALQNVRCVPLIATAKPQQRMLEQREQCYRFQTGNGSLCGKPREDTR